MSVMEVSHRSKAFIAVAEQAEQRPARAAGRAGELQGAVPAGRRHRAVRGHAAEPRRGRLPPSTTSTPATGRRRPSARRSATAQGQRGRRARRRLQLRARGVHLEAQRRCGLPALHAQRDHWRRGVPVHPADRRRAAGRGLSPRRSCPAARCVAIRAHLRRRAEEHRPVGPVRGHRARRPAGQGARRARPPIWDYRQMAADGSMSNTPPTFGWYVAGLVFKWLQAAGRPCQRWTSATARKAAELYAVIDGSGFYRNPVRRRCRSIMNVPFTLAKPELDKPFLAEAQSGRPGEPRRPSFGGWHARQHLQRDATRRRRGAGVIHEGVRTSPWLTPSASSH